MKKFLIAASALTLFSAPQAHAQLLSGGGLGQVTGGVAGRVTGVPGPILDRPATAVRSVTRGSGRADARTQGSQSVDRDSGAVAVDRSVDTGLEATTSQLLDTPAGPARGSASGSANAQLVGTDAVGGLAGETAGTARNVAMPAVGAARGQASGLAGQAGTLAGSADGAGSAAGSGSGALDNGILAVAGSGAAAGEGAFAIAPGVPVIAPDGAAIGKVRQVVGDARGRVQQVIVDAQGRDVAIPAGALAVSGSALVMGKGSAAGSTASPAPREDVPQEDATGSEPAQ